LALLLSIDTATEYAGVCISNNAEVLSVEESEDQKNHGAFIQPAIQKLAKRLNIQLKELDAIVVSGGPGSYTGLRVALSTAKGLCYALQKPLIMINTLEVMAYASINELTKSQAAIDDYLFCPMIDARRMEVFTAVFDKELKQVHAPLALILTEIPADFFDKDKTIVISGNGSKKLQNLNLEQKLLFQRIICTVENLAALGSKAFDEQRFKELAYSEPVYVKEFFSTASNRKIKNLL
jgi:tRNA threonylcarbamoyladenosine biosynthesis protein TsaB